MKEAESAEIKKIKHREVERVRHHKLQKLINNLANIVPDDNPSQNTQCAVLRKSLEYIEFLAAEYERIAENIEVESYSSSQGTVSSSQGPLVIDESYQQASGDSECGDSEKFPPLPSSLLSSDQEYFEYTPPFPIPYKNHSPLPSPPHLFSYQTPSFQFMEPQPPPPLPQLSQLSQQLPPQTDQKIFGHQPHCPSCNCFSRQNFTRDHLLTETLQDPYSINNEPIMSLWSY